MEFFPDEDIKEDRNHIIKGAARGNQLGMIIWIRKHVGGGGDGGPQFEWLPAINEAARYGRVNLLQYFLGARSVFFIERSPSSFSSPFAFPS